MVKGLLIGTYTCRAHGRPFSYEARWQLVDDRVTWSAKISFQALTVDAGAELLPGHDTDPGATVKFHVEQWIETFSCENEPPWPKPNGTPFTR